MLSRFMVWFAQWFASPKAVLQVTIITVLWVAIEAIFPHLDPNGFFLMYIFTLWSGWSQNILAYAANTSAEESRKAQDMLVQLLQNQAHQNAAMVDMIREIRELQRAIHKDIDEIADDIGDIKDELDD